MKSLFKIDRVTIMRFQRMSVKDKVDFILARVILVIFIIAIGFVEIQPVIQSISKIIKNN